ncbi:small basic family protein [Selenomonas sp.]|uniref:small basic family protein n=1 Tax=Selenomonas sp. TaxID=2053611 RepID=UPI002A7495D6|nr:small basic family protein [Selenomonas sp.]MDY3297257.1 small basic family protein [Selenomonas sp.]MDY4415124.1 small basic family protein [Selenomonas sp.]
MIFPILGLFIGLTLGFLAPVLVPFALAKYFSVAILAALDAVFGGLRSAVYDKFDNEVFVTGFFSNALMAAFLVFLGDKLGIDLYYVALLAFGFRIFKNLALLRRWILKKHQPDA